MVSTFLSKGYIMERTPTSWRKKFKRKVIIGKRRILTFTIDKLLSGYRRKKIKNKNFTIISNNCVAGFIYKKLGMQYKTPTIGMFFFSDDYIRFLENFEYYIKSPLKFIKTSKHPEANKALKVQSYPIGLLGEDVEIQFIHYETEEDASEKWQRRVERIALNNLFIIWSDRDNFRPEFIQRYKKLTFPNKIFFSSKPSELDFVVFIKDYNGESQVGEFFDREYEKYFDIIKWLNGETDFIK
jgi:uncharacterized protein (DUF1919 family)